MKKMLRPNPSTAILKKLLLLPMIIGLAFLCNTSHAQIINEGFEEPEWVTSTGNTQSGKITITATTANSVMTYYNNSAASSSTFTTAGPFTPNASYTTFIASATAATRTSYTVSLTNTANNTCPNSGVWWYSKAQTNTDDRLRRAHSVNHGMQLSTSGYVITPITKSAFVSVTFWAALAAPIVVGINTNTDAVQAGYNSSSTATALNAAGFTYMSQSFSSTGANSNMTSYSFTGTFSGPARIGFFNMGGSSIYVDDIIVMPPSGTPPLVSTVSATNVGPDHATINGLITPGTMPLLASGIIWSTSNSPLDTSLATKTRNTPSATGAFNNQAAVLQPLTNYFARAYVIDLAGNAIYGNIVPFQTTATTAPTVTTVTPYNVLSYKASSGGINIDSGGLAITQKGVCWSTTPNPTTASPRTSDGSNGNNYTSILKQLVPGTHYYARAYAVNSLGTGYGNEVQFDAAAPAPALIATPNSLNFGNIAFGSSSTVFSYTLTGYNLTAGGGTINIVPPAGYTVSNAPNTGFASPFPLTYTGNSLPSTTIYVKMSTGSYGSYNGDISHNGGGVSAANADSVHVTGKVIPDPTVTTNAGTDFWTGFGYQERMDRESGDNNEAKLSLYISVPQGSQPALINVEMPGIAGYANFQQNVSVAPGTIKEITGFPTGDPNDEYNPSGMPDTRLYYTGKSNRGIHIYSTNGVPVSVWMHSYAANNSAAAAMIFPTNTWNSSYTVQAYGGRLNASPYIGGFTNNSNPNSFFFVVANEDNTPIWFTPSQDILDSITGSSGTIFTENHNAAQVKYQKGITYGPIILNKGQIFNAMGFIQGSGNNANGLDLSGTTVKTNCDKKIAVFGGNGRCLVNASNCNASSGSDHMIQQMFPKVAWGTKYITVPTKTMEYNVFRIYVDSLNTKVWVNDPNHTTPLTGLIDNLYYQIQGSSANLIESDKPINVSQFITAGGCAQSNGAKGVGDPEMIILSPVQQAINNATVYSAGIKNSGATYNGHYINVVIRKGGIPSFRLDGAAVADTGINQATANNGTCFNTSGSIPIANAFIKLPYDTNYYWAKFRVAPLQAHRISSDSVFNAIAYGMGDGESYGYNAGTNIKDLTKPLFIDNPYLPNTTGNTACRGNTIYLKAVLPYPPNKIDSIKWYTGSVNGIQPQADYTQYFPNYDSTYNSDGVQYYVYKNPTPYVFNTVGSYKITGLVGGTFTTECGTTIPMEFNINIVDPGFADFSIQYNPCINDTVKFFDASGGNGFPIVGWRWDFGDNTVDTVLQNPTKVYATHAVYNVKLRAVNSIGCFADTTKVFDMITGLVAKFGVKDTICANSPVLFTDSSGNTGIGGSIVEWKWTFGETPNTPVIATTNAAQTHTYSTPGTYTVILVVKTSAGCTETYSKTITVRAVPLASFNMPAGICLPSGLTQFTNNSTISDGQTLTYSWNFGDPGSGANNTSTALSPSHTYSSTGPFSVNLVVTTQYGCTDDSLRTLSSVYPQPTAVIAAPASACMKDSVQFNDGSTAGTGNTVTEWTWAFGDGGTSSIQNPKHAYYVTGNQTVTLTVKSDKGCVSNPVTHTINIKPIPNVVFNAIPNICQNIASMPITQATETTGIAGASPSWVYTGTGVTGSNFSPSTAGAGTFPIIATYNAANGCKHADTTDVTVMPLPTVAFTVGSVTCEKASISFTDNSTPNSSSIQTWGWNFGDGSPNVNAQNTSHTYATAGSYVTTLTVTNSNNCTASLPQTVVVHNRPFASFAMPASVCLPDGNATFTNQSTVADDANPSFAWNFADPNNATGSTLKDPTHKYSSVGPFNVQLTVTSQYGCVKDTTRLFDAVHPEPVAAIVASPKEVCLGTPIAFTGQTQNAVTAWSWDFGDTQTDNVAVTSHTYTKAGIYDVIFFYNDGFGCKSNTATEKVTVNPYPVMDAGPTRYVLQGYSVQLQATASGSNLTYLWTPSLYLNDSSLLNPYSMPLADQFYTLKVTNAGGCFTTDTMTVKMLKEPEIPNAFSPNGDGINDKWEIGQLSYYFGCTVEVFNRGGQKLFSSVGYQNAWDGTHNGKPLPVGTYYYIINPKNGHPVMSGYVTILK